MRRLVKGMLPTPRLAVIALFGMMSFSPSTVASSHDHCSRVQAPSDAGVIATQMGLIRGHLWVAAELVALDQMALGAAHAKHPADEIYQSLLPLLKNAGAEGFAAELEALAETLQERDKPAFQRAYRNLETAMAAVDTKLSPSSATHLDVTVELIKQAQVEYAAGLVDGEIVDIKEYQDARGFLAIAEGLVLEVFASCGPLIAAAQQQAVREALALAKIQWPALSEPVVFVEEGDAQPWSGTALASLLTKIQALRNLMR